MKPIFALDLGTTKFCLGQLKLDHQSQPIKLISVPAAGMKRGMLADFQSAESTLKTLIAKAEDEWQIDIDTVVTGVAGSHLLSHRVSTSGSIAGQTVNETHLESLQQQAESQCWAEGREILHASAISYQLDDREAVSSPLGFSGRILKAEFFVVDGDASYLADLVRLINKAGLKVKQLYAEPLASASVTVSDEAKESGVVVGDIGGGTTDGLVFQQGKPVDAFSVNVGGKMFTSDLAIGLNIPLPEAERIKAMIGIDPRSVQPSEIKTVTQRGVEKTISVEEVEPILEARCFELTKLLFHQLLQYRRNFGAGLFLTGGGSHLKGLNTFMEQHLKVPVSAVDPTFSPFADDDPSHLERFPARYATCIGLLNLALGAQQEKKRPGQWPRRVVSQFMNWLRELS